MNTSNQDSKYFQLTFVKYKALSKKCGKVDLVENFDLFHNSYRFTRSFEEK